MRGNFYFSETDLPTGFHINSLCHLTLSFSLVLFKFITSTRAFPLTLAARTAFPASIIRIVLVSRFPMSPLCRHTHGFPFIFRLIQIYHLNSRLSLYTPARTTFRTFISLRSRRRLEQGRLGHGRAGQAGGGEGQRGERK